ncbi:putative glycoprotein 2 [Beihai Nido-like virus 2]|uniref:Putative glycoprotein 2 n=1 Tax=Beihai Nido-like virus 2 TaxID=1922351 RepID=A0A1L3KJ32_9NIDO|nr:putative glycoprotein 2 [Beihai Nido-like virus 2]APG77315.1 putative glycoprotein 2 [Beihai Nido-like virus 2]
MALHAKFLLLVLILLCDYARSIEIVGELRNLDPGTVKGLAARGSQLTRYTNFVQVSRPTQGTVREDHYVPHYVDIPLDTDLDYVVTGTSSLGTDFGFRVKVDDVNVEVENELIYTAPFYRDSHEDNLHQMVWNWDGSSLTHGVHIPTVCAGLSNVDYSFFECLRTRDEVAQLSQKDRECRYAPLGNEYLSVGNYTVKNPRGTCLNAESQSWWGRPFFTGLYKTGMPWIRAIDQWNLADCGTGSCTPSGQIRVLQRKWISGVNTAMFFKSTGKAIANYTISVSPEYGCDFDRCELHGPGDKCTLSVAGDTMSITGNDLETTTRMNIMVIAACGDYSGCQPVAVYRWPDDLYLTNAFPYLKWRSVPGPVYADEGKTKFQADAKFFPDVHINEEFCLDLGYRQDEGIAQYTHSSNKDGDANKPACRKKAPIISQSQREFEERGLSIDRCGDIRLEYVGDIDMVTLKYGKGYDGKDCEDLKKVNPHPYRYPLSAVKAYYNGCTGGVARAYFDIKSTEIVIDPPDGVDLSVCQIKMEGYYGLDNGITLTIGGCTVSGPVRLQLPQLDAYFYGDSKTLTTVLGASESRITITMLSYYDVLLIAEVFSSTITEVPVTALNADDAYTPDVIPPPSNDGGGFFDFLNNMFGNTFSIILIISAVILVGFILVSCCASARGGVKKESA